MDTPSCDRQVVAPTAMLTGLEASTRGSRAGEGGLVRVDELIGGKKGRPLIALN